MRRRLPVFKAWLAAPVNHAVLEYDRVSHMGEDDENSDVDETGFDDAMMLLWEQSGGYPFASSDSDNDEVRSSSSSSVSSAKSSESDSSSDSDSS